MVHASPDAGPVDVVPAGGAPIASRLQFPTVSPYAQVAASTYTLNVNTARTNTTAISVQNARLISGSAALLIPIGLVAVIITTLIRGRLAHKPKHAARPAPEVLGSRSGSSLF